MRKKRSVKKDKILSSKVDEKLKKAAQAALEKSEWDGGESAFLRECAKALVEQVENGDEIAQPVRFLTVKQRKALDVLDFQKGQQG